MELFEQLRHALNEFIHDHWIKALLTGAFFLCTTLYTGFWAWRAFKNREFYRRFNFSLNILRGGVLRIRTLSEDDAGEVVLNNEHAVRALIKAAKRTTVADPFLQLPGDIDWLISNSALNRLAEKMVSTGLFHQDVGLPVHVETYVIGLTCERDPKVQTRKVRAMVIREQTLLEIRNPEFPAPAFEQETHQVRWKTLLIMAQKYHANPRSMMKYEVVLPMYSPKA